MAQSFISILHTLLRVRTLVIRTSDTGNCFLDFFFFFLNGRKRKQKNLAIT